MTRFQIVGIFDDETLTAGEFNGDGYFEGGHGEEVCRAFSHMNTKGEYKKFAEEMNQEYFGYPENIIYNVQDGWQDFKAHNYYEWWFSDYLYIKNFSAEKITIHTIDEVDIELLPGGWATLYFGEYYEKEENYSGDACTSYNANINKSDRLQNIIEELGWTVEKVNDDYHISKCSTAGEDFGFDVSIDDAVREIIHYAQNFDVDEHVKMWIKSEGDGLPSIRELLEDAEEIQSDLLDLAEAVAKYHNDERR